MPTARTQNALRQVFGKRIGGLAVAFEVLDQETLQQALEIQARYCALQMAEKPVDMAEPWQTAPLFTRIRDTQSEEYHLIQCTSLHLRGSAELHESPESQMRRHTVRR